MYKLHFEDVSPSLGGSSAFNMFSDLKMSAFDPRGGVSIFNEWKLVLELLMSKLKSQWKSLETASSCLNC